MFWLCISALLLISSADFSNGMTRVRRLAGGEPVENGEMPCLVAIKKENIIVCGGVIISPTKVLTAANCNVCSKRSELKTVDDCIKSLKVIAGSSDLSKANSIYNVKSIKNHEKFVPGKFANDLAVITLESEIEYSDDIKAAGLPSEDITTKDSLATVGGWGAKSEGDKTGNILTSIEEKIISNEECNKLFQKKASEIDVNDFCAIPVAGTDKAGLCIGDSGVPLIESGKVIGISSWGVGCAKGYPDVFTNVFKHMDFVLSEMK